MRRLACFAMLLAGPAFADPPASPAPSTRATHAQAHHHPRHRTTVAASHLHPIPSQPPLPGQEPTATAAPMPNPDAVPPPGPVATAHAAPGIITSHYPEVGEGYVYGSSPQAMDDRNAAKAPGVDVTVPVK